MSKYMIKTLYRRKRLIEAINVNGATLIGTSKGYDVFDITTWAAAQEFTIENRADRAGAAYTRDQTTFESNINANQHLYFFVEENTNKTYGAVVKSNSTSGRIIFESVDGNHNVTVNSNFMFENAGDNSSNKCLGNHILPFYLIPGASFRNVISAAGLLINNSTLEAAIGGITPNTEINLNNLPELNVTAISSGAFTYGVNVSEILLDTNLTNISTDCLTNVDIVNVPFFSEDEAPQSWSTNWYQNNEVFYGYDATPEAQEAAQQREEERRRLEQERAEAERRAREEEQRREEERKREEERAKARQLNYVIEGKEVAIKGCRSNVTNLTIPEQIEDKPVTKIKANAFAFSPIVHVQLPSTLKVIEKEAFYESNLKGYTYVPENCIIGKNAFARTMTTIVRRSR